VLFLIVFLFDSPYRFKRLLSKILFNIHISIFLLLWNFNFFTVTESQTAMMVDLGQFFRQCTNAIIVSFSDVHGSCEDAIFRDDEANVIIITYVADERMNYVPTLTGPSRALASMMTTPFVNAGNEYGTIFAVDTAEGIEAWSFSASNLSVYKGWKYSSENMCTFAFGSTHTPAVQTVLVVSSGTCQNEEQSSWRCAICWRMVSISLIAILILLATNLSITYTFYGWKFLSPILASTSHTVRYILTYFGNSTIAKRAGKLTWLIILITMMDSLHVDGASFTPSPVGEDGAMNSQVIAREQCF